MIFIYKFMPFFLQNTLVTLYNTYLYKVRHGGKYKEYFKYHSEKLRATENNNELIEKKLTDFLSFSIKNSKWYSQQAEISSLKDFPILTKSDLIRNLDDISTLNEREGIVSLTGGTTGASMKVIYTKHDMQERFAILDAYRGQFGYQLGKKTAWFSGKNLTTNKDLKKGRCYRDDWINKIRFFSTFHIAEKNFDIYWAALQKYNPEFIVGFPSSVYELCSIALSNGYKYSGSIKCFFPTAETLLPNQRDVISKVFNCNIKDQYASSEGAPFILECEYGNKHLYPFSGIFEVVDKDLNASLDGELLVTSFTTHGTPLIRYRIGDSLKLDEGLRGCECLSPYPIVDKIQGRNSDFLYTSSLVKVNLGNISNCTKDILGIICFQIIQDSLEKINVSVVSTMLFDNKQKVNFTKALKERMGDDMNVSIHVVDEIPKELSGKFRIVKNNLI